MEVLFEVITNDVKELPVFVGTVREIAANYGKHENNIFQTIREKRTFLNRQYRIIKVTYEADDTFDDLVETDECRAIFARLRKDCR